MLDKLKKLWRLVQSHPTEAILLIAALFLLLLVLSIFAPGTLLLATGAVVLGWAVYTPPVQPPEDCRGQVFCHLLDMIFSARRDLFPVVRVMPMGSYVMGPLVVIQAVAEKAPNANCNPDIFAVRLQTEIDVRLQQYRVPGVPASNPDGSRPWFVILDVTETENGYIIQGVYLNSQKRYQDYQNTVGVWYTQDLSKLTTQVETPDDEEF